MPKNYRLGKDYFGLLRTNIFQNLLFIELQKGVYGFVRMSGDVGSGFLLAPLAEVPSVFRLPTGEQFYAISFFFC